MSTVIAERHETGCGCVWVTFDYSPEVLDMVRALPVRKRQYRADRSMWQIDPSVWPMLQRALEVEGHRVVTT